MPSCVIKHCKNCSQKLKKEVGVSFHKFPADETLREKWIALVRESRQEQNWAPSKFCVICSSHFHENDTYFTSNGRKWLKKKSIPTLKLCETPLPPEPSGSTTEDLSRCPVEGVCRSTCTSPNATLASKLPESSDEGNSIDSDLESIFDTPRIACLRKRMKKLESLRVSSKRKLKTLKQKVQRLKKRNISLKNILKELKDK